MHRKLILVGIDGATWKILTPLISEGILQNFSTLASKGTVSILQSTVPPESPPAWTSMFTGVNPGKHGIVDFLLFEGSKFVPCMSYYRMSKTIWRMISDSGRKCIIVNDPVSFPPEQVNGIMTSGLMTPPGSMNWVYPERCRDELDTVAGGYECDIPTNFRTILSRDREAALGILSRLMSKVFRVSTYAASNFEWDIIAVIFTATDRLQHFWWNDSLQISEYYKRLDMMLGKYMEYAEIMSADLMVVSDHGFGPCERLVSINRSLEEAGLAVRTESPFSKVLSRAGFTRGRIRNIMGEWPAAFNVLPGPLQDMIRRFVPESAESTMEIDVARSFAYAKTAAGVFLQNGSMRGIVAKKLSELSDKITGDPIVEKVISRDEALQGAYSYRAPDLFLQTRLGYGFSIDKTDLEKGLVGTHRPEGIFMHYRPNSSSNHQELLAPIRPWDVAASILHILKVPVPDYFDGRPKIRRD